MAEIPVEVIQYICERCAHMWVARKGRPRQCPRCKSVWWDTPKPPVPDTRIVG